MSTIKPIETVYKGYRFRSRLEARWAVFFDNFGITYQYEMEGFKLENGTRYLPDFWLPKVNLLLGEYTRDLYFEVKPKTDLEKTTIEKIVKFSGGIKDGIIICFGDPWIDTRVCYIAGNPNETYFASDCKFAAWQKGETDIHGIAIEKIVKELLGSNDVYKQVTQEKEIINAYQIARSTRFEYNGA
jgi:hypothetical protein